MEWPPVVHEPNLKFVLGLEHGFRKQYYEEHEKAKQTLASFTSSLQNVRLEYQKVLDSKVELYIFGESMKQIVKDCKCYKKIPNINNNPNSEVISASTNCNLKVAPRSFTKNDKKVDDKVEDNNVFVQKEDICEFVPIYTEDFNSDIEEGCFDKNKSPPRPVVNNPAKVQSSPTSKSPPRPVVNNPAKVQSSPMSKSPPRPVLNNSAKVQSSPILSKSKRHGSKKSNSSMSNNSITSSNDSKISLTPSNLGFDNELEAEFEKKFDREPLHGIENNIGTPPSQDKSISVLSVSKVDYGKTEFTERGKKLRQSKLTLKKIIPVIDLSKVDSDENFNNSKGSQSKNSSSRETFFNKESPSKNTSIKKQSSFKNSIGDKKEFEIVSDPTSPAATKNLNQTCEDELVETSPAQNETSKLRNKLNMKKPEMNKLKLKHKSASSDKVTDSKSSKSWTSRERKSNETDQNQHDSKNNFEKYSRPSTSTQKPIITINELSQPGEKRKSFDCQKSSNDETYFSLAEASAFKNHDLDFDIDATNFEDEMKSESPPLKKMLMTSFDIIPGRREKSPGFAYKDAPVRKKAERALLPGWSCKDCEQWYDNLPDKEKKKRQDECSRHRGKYKANISTPESFWNPEFDNDGSNSSSNY